jgi:hypothetical protein
VEAFEPQFFLRITLICAAEVTGLIHMKEYMFRVRAVNAIGESDPLDTDKGVVAKNPYGLFLIHYVIT